MESAYLNPIIIDHNGFIGMCGYQPTCACKYTKYLDKCPDYCPLYYPKATPIKADEIPVWDRDEITADNIEENEDEEKQTTLDLF